MAANEDSKGVGDHPTTDENKWFSYAVTLAIFTAVAAVCSAVWVFSEGEPETRSRLASTLVPFGTMMIAAVTFCTVAWRGLVGSRQADQQKRQNDASDDANFAKLLQEGAKLIADDKTPSQVAGVASLDILLTEPRARYASQARDVLAESMRKIIVAEIGVREPNEWISGSVYAAIQTNLTREASEGRFSNVELSLHFDSVKSLFTYWPTFTGFRICKLAGGSVIRAEKFENLNRDMIFRRVKVTASTCKAIDYRYQNCEFKGCKILALDDLDSFGGKHNTYTKCDFSGCELSDQILDYEFKKLILDGCWFDVQNPPKFSGNVEIYHYFEQKIRVSGSWKNIDEVDLEKGNLSETQRAAIHEFLGLKNN